MTFKDELIEAVEGQVRFDDISRSIYSVDASIYEVAPIGVVIPKTREDLRKAVNIASRYGVAVIPRGAATGTTGGCLGTGLVVDTTKYFNKILEINIDKRYVVCQPGVVQDDLNDALEVYGFQLGPNTSTGNRATIGGMLANNAAGSHSLIYGQMKDHVLEVEVILISGEVVNLREISIDKWEKKCLINSPKGKIYKQLWEIRKEYEDTIEKEFPKIKRRSSGYNIDELIQKGSVNLSRLFAGSEGGLGIAAKIKMKIVPKQKTKVLFAIHFSDLLQSMKSVESLLAYNPSAIELIDKDIIDRGKSSPTMKDRLSWLEGDPAAVIVVEFSENNEGLEKLREDFQAVPLDDNLASDIWAVRKAGLELLLSKRSYQRAVAFIEDLAVPPSELASFMEGFLAILNKAGRTAGIYGHVGESCLHIRPYINLMKEGDIELMKKMMEEVSSLVLKHGGVMSGEHGDGLVRTKLNEKMFTPRIYEAFTKVKAVFDPHNLMNPSKVVHGGDFTHDLRSSPESTLTEFKTFLDFAPEGGFELAVDMCNGNGLCRKKEGVMCPSFQATLDEYDTTRARAQVLRSIIHGKLKPESLAHSGVRDVLDLCLECKGCKKECPSQVDMAKIKSEALYQHNKKYGIPLRSRLFGHFPEFNRFGSKFPAVMNFLGRTKLFKWLGGIALDRKLPEFAAQRFSFWLASYKQPEECQKEVVLFNDTYTEFNHPEIGRAAVAVLNAMGYRAIVPPWQCCGRPLISKGMLDKAKLKAEDFLQTFRPFAEKGIPIIVLEPSCLSVFQDELAAFGLIFPGECVSFDRFLAERLDEIPLKKTPYSLKLHVHCHQKALEGTDFAVKVLASMPAEKFAEITSGCCGMAGSFGYEKEHYDLSMKIGGLKLFREIAKSDLGTLIAASGTSCRAQIQHGTGVKAHHLAEVVAKFLDS